MTVDWFDFDPTGEQPLVAVTFSFVSSSGVVSFSLALVQRCHMGLCFVIVNSKLLKRHSKANGLFMSVESCPKGCQNEVQMRFLKVRSCRVAEKTGVTSVENGKVYDCNVMYLSIYIALLTA